MSIHTNSKIADNVNASENLKNSFGLLKRKVAFQCAILLAVVLLFASSCAHSGIATNSKQSISNQEDRAIEVIRVWYRKKGYSVPDRIQLLDVNDNLWRFTAGQQDIESVFSVDVKKMQVVEFTPGL